MTDHCPPSTDRRSSHDRDGGAKDGEPSWRNDTGDGDESTGAISLTTVPPQIQRAASTLTDDSSDVYHVVAELTESASTKDREALVEGLDDASPAVAYVDGEESAEDVLEFVTAPNVSIDAIADAIERCAFVNSVMKRQIATRGTGGNANDETENHDAEAFEEILDSTESVEPEALLTHPEYIDLLDQYDEFSLPEDDISLNELIDGSIEDGDAEWWDGTVPDEPSDRPDRDSQTEHDSENDDRREEHPTPDRRTQPRGECDDRHSEPSSATDPPERTDATPMLERRVRYLESRFTEFAAYDETTEEVLIRQSDHGKRIDELETAVAELEATVGTLETENSHLLGALAVLFRAIETSESERDELATLIDGLDRREERLRDDLDEMASWRARVAGAMQVDAVEHSDD